MNEKQKVMFNKLDKFQGFLMHVILLTLNCVLPGLTSTGGIPSGRERWGGKIGPSGWTGSRISAAGYCLGQPLEYFQVLDKLEADIR